MHWIDLILLALLGHSALKGMKSGVVTQVWSLIVLILAFRCSGLLTPYLDKWLLPLLGSNHLIWLSWITAFCAILVIGKLLTKPITSILSFPLGFLNNLLGAIVSLAITALVLGVLCQCYQYLLLPLDFPPFPTNLKVLPYLLRISETLSPNYLFPLGGGSVTLAPIEVSV